MNHAAFCKSANGKPLRITSRASLQLEHLTRLQTLFEPVSRNLLYGCWHHVVLWLSLAAPILVFTFFLVSTSLFVCFLAFTSFFGAHLPFAMARPMGNTTNPRPRIKNQKKTKSKQRKEYALEWIKQRIVYPTAMQKPSFLSACKCPSFGTCMNNTCLNMKHSPARFSSPAFSVLIRALLGNYKQAVHITNCCPCVSLFEERTTHVAS